MNIFFKNIAIFEQFKIFKNLLLGEKNFPAVIKLEICWSEVWYFILYATKLDKQIHHYKQICNVFKSPCCEAHALR